MHKSGVSEVIVGFLSGIALTGLLGSIYGAILPDLYRWLMDVAGLPVMVAVYGSSFVVEALVVTLGVYGLVSMARRLTIEMPKRRFIAFAFGYCIAVLSVSLVKISDPIVHLSIQIWSYWVSLGLCTIWAGIGFYLAGSERSPET